MATFRWLPVGSPLHDPVALDRLLEGLRPALEGIGGIRAGEDELDAPEPLLYLALTGGTERRILDLRHRRTEHEPGEPTVLLAHPGHNSLPAALEALARVRQLGGRGRICYLRDPGDAEGLSRVAAAAHDLAVRRSLHEARIGLVGEPSDWLVASSPDPEVVRATWGPRVVRLDVAEVIRRHALAPTTGLAPAVAAGATAVAGPDPERISEASRVHPVLRDLVTAERLDALTVRCFDLVSELRTSSCLALAELNDEGVIAGCEGDLVSTVTMLWIHRLLGRLPWMANPARVDEATNAVLLAHCTVPRTLVERYRLRTHFESGIGVGLSGDLPPGDVTLVRIGGLRMDELWLAEGTSVATEPREDLCRTQLEVRLERGSVADLLRAPLGNHLVLVAGHHADRMLGWWETTIAA
jgi:L-fucose isomerase-like protein